MSTQQNDTKAGTPSPERLGSQKDELYDTAKTLVIEKQRAGLHLLQTHLKIGFMRASLLMDELERNGVIGAFNGNEPRKVLITNDKADFCERSEAE